MTDNAHAYVNSDGKFLTYDVDKCKHFKTEKEALTLLNNIVDEAYELIEDYVGKNIDKYFPEFENMISKSFNASFYELMMFHIIGWILDDGEVFKYAVPRKEFKTGPYKPCQILLKEKEN